MKKILSLLALLMTTVVAFATDYTDAFTCTTSVAGTETLGQKTLTITDNGDGTYDVVIKDFNSQKLAQNFGDMTFAGMSGTTADGVTTITAADVTASQTDGTYFKFKATEATVKFNADKAYFHAKGIISDYYTFELTFGTDEGFSGGGPVDPGTDPSVPVDLVEADYNPSGEAFLFHAPINWDTQKLVAKIDLSTCKNESAENEQVFSCGTENLDWNTDVFTFFRKRDVTCQSYTNGGGVNTGAQRVDNTQPITIELSKANGYSINGTVDVIEASKLSKIFALSTIYVGSTDGDQASNATYKYIKVVPLDWTEPTEPTEPEEPTTYDYHTKAYVEYNGTFTDIEGGADVVVTEYADGKCSATFKKVTDGESIYGDLTFNNLTATTSDEGTKYELTDDSKAVWTGVTPAGIMSGITENGNATFSDFFCATGELAGNDYNFALSFKVNVSGSDLNIVFGEEAPKATSYTGTWNVTRKGSTLSESTDNSVVSILLKNESTAQVTIPAFSDLEEEDAGSVASLTFDVLYSEALSGDERYIKFYGSNDDVEITEGDWEQQHASISMDGKLVDGKLTATFNVVLNGMEEYTYELGFNVMPFVASTETFNDVANVTFGEQTANFDAASVDVTEYEQGKFSLTYKSLTLNGNEVGDFTISDIAAAEDETTGVYTFSTTATKGEWTRVVENNAAGVEAGDEAEIRNFEATLTPAADESEDAGKLVAKFGVNVQGEWADVVFGAKHEEEASEIVLAENYQADGTGFTFSTPIDWDTQKVVISANTESCQRSTEHLFGVGVDGTSWNKNVHLYYTSDSKLQGYWDGADGGGNNNTGKFDCNGTVKAEISKANGFVVDGETKIAASRMDGLYEMTNIVVGSGEASNQESYAYYNYIKIVPLDWTEPAQPEAKTYDGQLLVKDGLTEDKVLEKREAQAVVTDNLDGTATITLKDVTLGEVTGDVTFTGTYVTAEDDGEDIFMLQGTTDEATTALFGKEFTAVLNGTYKSDDEVYFTFEMFDADQTTYYVGVFGKNILDVDGVNGISANANAAGTQIFTISGAKVNSLQKGVNIVRTADGKTVKVLRK